MRTLADRDYCSECGYPKLGVCGRCRERKAAERESERLAKESARVNRLNQEFVWGGARALDTFTFEAFKTSPNNTAAAAAANELDLSMHNAYIMGPTGTGKTHLAVAIARRDHNISHKVVWKPTEIARELRSSESAVGEQGFIDQIVSQRRLVIDDLGIEKLTEFLQTLLYEIIDGRYMTAKGGLIITSNLSLDALADHIGDDRISSRIAGMSRIISLKGEVDRRIT